MLVVPGTFAQIAVLTEALPCIAPVVGTEDGTILSFDDGPNTVCPGSRDSDTDLAFWPGGKPWLARNIGPGITAVG